MAITQQYFDFIFENRIYDSKQWFNENKSRFIQNNYNIQQKQTNLSTIYLYTYLRLQVQLWIATYT